MEHDKIEARDALGIPEEAYEGAKAPMTASEMGKKGGQSLREKRGREWFAKIGKKGGKAKKAKRDKEKSA